ncbi:hypothetical protein LNJ06_12645 [Tenacibaculum finnmarkense genomovar ulcerans]|uniref:hypothetical protein n=1 Tax=Tenacibaculum finnmarkense TaxID=2781243 RepID=UPI001E634074|nr:hypothetical protein [Tenacibaculum finnmarkense]MCD8431017.1 hypothetical protein [Tenacibaculum finnmarkense genomovar ulcerans]
MLDQIKLFRENQQKKPLYKSLTSMRSLAVSIQSYNIFYAIKFASFFYLLAATFIPNDYVRVLSSLFFGLFSSKTMKDIGIHIEKSKEWVIVSLAVFDFLMLCVILDVFHKTDHIDILNSLIFCLFVPYIGYWLNHVFVLKVKENEGKEIADTEKLIASLEQRLVAYKMQVTELEKNGTDADHGRPNTDHGQPNTDHGRPNTDHGRPSTDHGRPNTDQVKEGSQTDLLDSINNTCPHCKLVYPSKRSRDSHKGKCKLNPKNITK